MNSLPALYNPHILLADDDDDDCFLFKYACEELPIPYSLKIVNNGEELMQLLNKDDTRLPDVLFLDLNMPRKNGFECLVELKRDEKLKQVPVIIFSTSFTPVIIRQVYEKGAQYFIRKPDDISKYKKVIYHALTLIALPAGSVQPPIEKFVLTHEYSEHENK